MCKYLVKVDLTKGFSAKFHQNWKISRGGKFNIYVLQIPIEKYGESEKRKC